MKTIQTFIFFLISVSSISQIPTNGLIGWYPFNGNANDESGNSRHGTVYGAVLTIDRRGVPNNAYSFNGLSNYISLPNVAVQASANRTISFWIKTNVNMLGSMVVSTGTDAFINSGNFNLRLENNNSFIGFMGGNFTGGYDYYPMGNIQLNDNNWHNILVTFDGANLRFYVDGVFEKAATCNMSGCPSNLSTNGQANFIGKSNHIGAEAWYIGEIDDVGFWNRVLTSTEITSVYNSFYLLPLQWGNFTGSENNKIITLNWETLQEINTLNFIIEHSGDGINWNQIGAVGSANNSTELKKYSFIHRSPSIGKNFYRIVQKDIDGKKSISKTINVQIEKNNLPEFWISNPANNEQFSLIMLKPGYVLFYNNSGLLLWNKQYLPGTYNIGVGNLSKGVYFIKVNNTTQKMLVQ